MLNPSFAPVLFGAAPAVEVSDQLLAYIGPGVGLGAIAIAVALALGVLLLLIGLVWYPLKRLRKGGTTDTAGGSRLDDIE